MTAGLNRRRQPGTGNADRLPGLLPGHRGDIAGGLSDAAGARRLLPSLTTVSGLVQHPTDVGRFWFQDRIDGQPGVPTRSSAEVPAGEFRVNEEDSLAEIIAFYEAACRQSRGVLDILRGLLDGTTGD